MNAVSDAGSHNPSFTLRVSASRLEKGLLAIPQRFKDLFPAERCQIKVLFDDGDKPEVVTFHPLDSKVKEARIFGLAGWFSKRNVQEGDVVSIRLEDPIKQTYRIVLNRYIRQLEEKRTRQRLRSASTDAAAREEIANLARLTNKRPRKLAAEELMRIVQASPCRPRPRVVTAASLRYEGVPSGIRALLRELHEGRCQICSFTFEKRDGNPYFEIHHLDPEVGHHPCNLLVLCSNCHAQLEHASVSSFEWTGNWVVGLTVNEKRMLVRQPLAHDSTRRSLLGIGILFGVAQLGRLLFGETSPGRTGPDPS
jgi:5-methylcytosine-specific restriction endonuclease McrA